MPSEGRRRPAKGKRQDANAGTRQQPRDIERTGTFKRDYKRELAGRHGKTLANDLTEIVKRLVMDLPLDRRRVDHPLAGQWKDHRDCRVKPDLVLIYRKPDDDTLQLVRLGSHSELGMG
jgi:mRNA interferase YafQ